MDMMYYENPRSSYQEFLKILEADIQHANDLAASIPRAKGGTFLQMKFVYSPLAPLFLFLLQWMDCSCTWLLPRYLNLFHVLVYKVYTDGKRTISSHGRKATIRDFYAIIFPSLQRLHSNSEELLNNQDEVCSMEMFDEERVEERKKFSDVELEREDECGLCMEPCTKIVLPNCCHAMCINCYHDWSSRSESCPFCRGSLKRINSEDLWVLTCNSDVVDAETVTKEDLFRFYLYINSLPKDLPDSLFLVYYEYLI